MSDCWDRVDRVLERHAPLVFNSLRPPATETQISEMETLVGVRFPEEIRVAYLRHDGQCAGDHWLIPAGNGWPSIFLVTGCWCNLQQMKAIWQIQFKTRWETRANCPEMYPQYDSSWDALEIRPERWNRGWIPISINPSLYNLYVDMAPAPAGKLGQIIVDDDQDEPGVVMPGLDIYLTALCDALESGEVVHDPIYGFIGGRRRLHIHTIYPTVRLWENMPVPLPG
jgi:cell wall assembly regulator SMI1